MPATFFFVRAVVVAPLREKSRLVGLRPTTCRRRCGDAGLRAALTRPCPAMPAERFSPATIALRQGYACPLVQGERCTQENAHRRRVRARRYLSVGAAGRRLHLYDLARGRRGDRQDRQSLYAQPTSCTVSRRFAGPGGPATVNCTQQIPGGAKNWYVCLRPTGGKALTFESGSETCKKPPAG